MRGSVSPQFLLGTYYHNLDDKSRVIVPATYRPALGNKFYLTKSLRARDKHLSLYPEVEYVGLVTKLEAKARGNANLDWLLRDFYSYALEAEMDSQGRIVIPAPHRDFARLVKRVVFMGRQTHAELWDAETFEEGQRGASGDLADYLD